ncbi:UNVERIFIED_CONTAM: DNA/RNA non-specific endonuclease [Acetivibrio alkalicellulosi]
MAYKVTICDGTILEKNIQFVTFDIDQPDDYRPSKICSRKSMTITGKIDTEEETISLYKWALISANEPSCYKRVTIEQTQANQLIRKVTFDKAFVVDYSESYRKDEGIGVFTIYIRQMAGLDIECASQITQQVEQRKLEENDGLEKVSIVKKKVAPIIDTLSSNSTGNLKTSFKGKIAKKKKMQDNSSISSPLTEVKYGEQFTKKDRKKVLKPNVQYATPEGYLYKTDDLGRIVRCEGTLAFGIAKRNEYAQRTVGREDRLSDDDGGHLIASIFKGSGDFDNLVPMNGNLNKGEWKKLEIAWGKALNSKPPKEVKVKITPVYEGNSQRPVRFEIENQVGNRQWEIIKFKNSSGG